MLTRAARKRKLNEVSRRHLCSDIDEPPYIFSRGWKLYAKGYKPRKEGEQPLFTSTEGVAWLKRDKLHRAHDKPAVVDNCGARLWYFAGALHREGDKPAFVDAQGNMTWYFAGTKHRDHGKPAVVNADGSKEWWCYGFLVRRSVDVKKRLIRFYPNDCDRWPLEEGREIQDNFDWYTQ